MQRTEGLLTPENVQKVAFAGQIFQVARGCLSLMSFHPISAVTNIAIGLYLEKGLVLGCQGAQSVFTGTTFADEAKKYGAYISANYSQITKLSDIVSSKVSTALQNFDVQGCVKNMFEKAQPPKP